jgi:hypothetical protein
MGSNRRSAPPAGSRCGARAPQRPPPHRRHSLWAFPLRTFRPHHSLAGPSNPNSTYSVLREFWYQNFGNMRQPMVHLHRRARR